MAGDRADQAGVKQGRLRGALNPIVEIGGDLEQIREFIVVGAERVIEIGRANQHDLDIERDRFGSKRDRACHAQQLLQAFDANLAGVQRAL